MKKFFIALMLFTALSHAFARSLIVASEDSVEQLLHVSVYGSSIEECERSKADFIKELDTKMKVIVFKGRCVEVNTKYSFDTGDQKLFEPSIAAEISFFQ